MNKANEIRNKLQICPVALFLTNTGKGKSNSVSEFVELVKKDDYLYKSSLGVRTVKTPRVIFATNTRDNRDAMHQKNNAFVIVKGVAEILEEEAPRAAQEYIRLLKEEPEERTRFVRLIRDGFLTEIESKRLKSLISDEFNKLQYAPFITMTFQKLLMFKKLDFLNNAYVFLDEMRQDRIWTGEGDFKIWGNKEESFIDKKVNNLTETLIRKANNNDIKGVALLSAEESLQAAIDSPTFPKFNKFGDFYKISSIDPLHDDKLTVCVVHGTSDRKHTKRTFAKLARQNGYTVVCDGKDENNNAIGDLSIEAVKGRNDLTNIDLCTIISTPHPKEIAPLMGSCSLSEQDAISLIVSDKANQAIGRNTGYRNHGSGNHILIVPEKIYNIMNLHTTGNVVHAKKRSDVADLEGVAADILKGFYKDKVYYCQIATYRAYCKLRVDYGYTATVKSIKNEITDALSSMGLSDDQIKRDTMIKTCVDYLLTYDVEQKRKQINGVRVDCFIEKEIEMTIEQQELSDALKMFDDIQDDRSLTRDENIKQREIMALYMDSFK